MKRPTSFPRPGPALVLSLLAGAAFLLVPPDRWAAAATVSVTSDTEAVTANDTITITDPLLPGGMTVGTIPEASEPATVTITIFGAQWGAQMNIFYRDPGELTFTSDRLVLMNAGGNALAIYGSDAENGLPTNFPPGSDSITPTNKDMTLGTDLVTDSLTAVPEPASILQATLAAIVGVGYAARRRLRRKATPGT